MKEVKVLSRKMSDRKSVKWKNVDRYEQGNES